MPKLILKTLVGYLTDKRFKEYFKGEWSALEDDRVIYKFDPQASSIIVIHNIANFFIEFVEVINVAMKCELKTKFINNGLAGVLDFQFEIKTEDKNKGATLLYTQILNYIENHINQIHFAEVVAAEFIDKFVLDIDLLQVTIFLPTNLLMLIKQDSKLRMQIYKWKITERGDNYNVDVVLPEKFHLVEKFLKKIDDGLKALFAEFELEDNLPRTFYTYKENKIILDFKILMSFVDKYPQFTIGDCIRGKLKVDGGKSPTNLFKSKSSPESNSPSPTIFSLEKQRSYSEPLPLGDVSQILPPSENKTRDGFFKKFTVRTLLFNKRPGRPRSDSGLLAKPDIEESQYFPPLPEVNNDSKEVSQQNDKKESRLKRTKRYKIFTHFGPLRDSVAANVLSNSDKENFEENTPPLSEKQQKAAETTKIEKGQDDSDSEEAKSETGCPTLP